MVIPVPLQMRQENGDVDAPIRESTVRNADAVRRRTKYCAELAVFAARFRADEAAEVVVLDLFLVSKDGVS